MIIKFNNSANAFPPEAAAVQTVEEVYHEINFELLTVMTTFRLIQYLGKISSAKLTANHIFVLRGLQLFDLPGSPLCDEKQECLSMLCSTMGCSAICTLTNRAFLFISSS